MTPHIIHNEDDAIPDIANNITTHIFDPFKSKVVLYVNLDSFYRDPGRTAAALL